MLRFAYSCVNYNRYTSKIRSIEVIREHPYRKGIGCYLAGIIYMLYLNINFDSPSYKVTNYNLIWLFCKEIFCFFFYDRRLFAAVLTVQRLEKSVNCFLFDLTQFSMKNQLSIIVTYLLSLMINNFNLPFGK